MDHLLRVPHVRLSDSLFASVPKEFLGDRWCSSLGPEALNCVEADIRRAPRRDLAIPSSRSLTDDILTAAGLCLFAEIEEVALESPSMIDWMYESLGPFYGLLLSLTGLVVFIGSCFVVALSKRPQVIAAYLVFVPAPS